MWYRFRWEDTFTNKDDVPLVIRDKRQKIVGTPQGNTEVEGGSLFQTSDSHARLASSSASKVPQQQVSVSGPEAGLKRKRLDKSKNDGPAQHPGVLQTWHGWPAPVKSEPRDDPNQGSKSVQQQEEQKATQGQPHSAELSAANKIDFCIAKHIGP